MNLLERILNLPDDIQICVAQHWIKMNTLKRSKRTALARCLADHFEYKRLKLFNIRKIGKERIEQLNRLLSKRPLPITRIMDMENKRIVTTTMEMYSKSCSLHYMYHMRYHELIYLDDPQNIEKRWCIHQIEFHGSTRKFDREHFKVHTLFQANDRKCEWQG
jgi:hypothetical protein